MYRKRLLFLFYMCTTAVSSSLAFNIDLKNPEIYNGTAEDFFGYKVLQVGSQNKTGIIVTAPLFMNGTGAVYHHGKNQEQDRFIPKALTVEETELPVKHFGLSIAKDLKLPQFTVCSPNVVTKCYENSYMNSVCYNLTNQLQELSKFTPAFQACTKKIVDLVFLFDGSRSMLTLDFDKNKYFILNMMSSLKNTSIKFAAVQFSKEPRTVFTFNDYVNDKAISLLENENHMQSLTNTHQALRFVMKEHFENPANGASPEATKVLVLITDGDPSDENSGDIEDYDSKNIIRLVIGVKMNDLSKVMSISSDPKENNTFPIENYDGLTGVLENFQKKIFQTEGTTAALAGDLTEEMSQTGFSAVYSRDALLLGSVGSNTWKGSLLKHQGSELQIIDPLLEEDSYMGYSVAVGEKNNKVLYFTGAPRYNHIGQVIMFRLTGTDWTPAQRINGEEHGSYFGGELCSLDVDSDGSTDFLLVGAPLFYQPHEKKEGKIYVYALNNQLKLIKRLNVTAPALGRFGTTITSVADLNGDRLRDVAVGAPLENDHRGAVYIYVGHRTTGIRSTYSQRIMGEKVSPELRFFGQSIDGSSDLGNDLLPDLVIGSRGAAVVLQSKPVFSVSPRLFFEPHEISIEKINCPSSKEDFLPLVNLRVCFEMVEATKSRAGAVKPGLNISYTLSVDPMRQTFRGFFNSTTKIRNVIKMCELRDRQTCFNHSVFMPKCITDTLSPVSIKLNFSQVDSERAEAALNCDSTKEAVLHVPFERRCKNNDSCVAELEVDFNFTTPTLLVSDNNYFNVMVTLLNRGEDSYNTSLTILQPPGLSFSRITLNQESKSNPLYICEDYTDRLMCGISHPVYRSGSAATFTTMFHVKRDYDWKDTMSMTLTGNSDNQNSTKGSLTKDIPVQFEIKFMLLIAEDTVTYLNFTTDDTAPKRLVTKYTVDNYGWMPFPANVTLFFPTKLEHNLEMNNYKVFIEQNATQCKERDTEPPITSEYCTSERKCKYIICDTFILNNNSAVEFELSGEVQFKDLNQYNVPFLKRYTGGVDKVDFESFLHVSFDKEKYALDSNQRRKDEMPGESSLRDDNDPTIKLSEVQIELIVLPDKMLIIVTGVGVGLLLFIIITIIMFKLGCFKRKMHDMIQEEEDAAGNGGVISEAANEASDTPEEVKGLLEKQEPSPISPMNDYENTEIGLE